MADGTEPVFTPAAAPANGRRSAPDDVWAAVRDDYLAGVPATECCRRHGVGLTVLRGRAALEGWRRADQPWIPPRRLDPWDEGVLLEETVGGDLDKVELRQLTWIADRRMMRAVLRGDAMEALRWRRVRAAVEADAYEVERLIAEDEALRWSGEGADDPDGPDGPDGVSAAGR